MSTIGKVVISILVAWSAITVRGAVQELKRAERKDDEEDLADVGNGDMTSTELRNIVETVPLRQQSYPLG